VSIEDNSKLAPPDPTWHLRYELVFMRFEYELAQLKVLESFEHAEDLGDYIECIETLMSFRPRSRWDIQAEARVMTEKWVEDSKARE